MLGSCLHSKPRALTYILCLPGEWKFWNGLKQSPGSLWETPVSTHLTEWMPLAMPISWWPKGTWTHVLRCNIEAYLISLCFTDTLKTPELKICGSPTLSKSIYGCHFSSSICSLYVLVSHFGNSQYFTFFHYYIVKVICYQWFLMLKLQKDYSLRLSSLYFLAIHFKKLDIHYFLDIMLLCSQ